MNTQLQPSIISSEFVQLKTPYANHFNFVEGKWYEVIRTNRGINPADNKEEYTYRLKNEDGEELNIITTLCKKPQAGKRSKLARLIQWISNKIA